MGVAPGPRGAPPRQLGTCMHIVQGGLIGRVPSVPRTCLVRTVQGGDFSICLQKLVEYKSVPEPETPRALGTEEPFQGRILC